MPKGYVVSDSTSSLGPCPLFKMVGGGKQSSISQRATISKIVEEKAQGARLLLTCFGLKIFYRFAILVLNWMSLL